MKPEILTTQEEGMDWAEIKEVIGEVRIKYRGKTYAMGFITVLRLLQEFEAMKEAGLTINLRDYDQYFVVPAVTVDEMSKVVVACEKENRLKYYLASE